MTTNNDMKWQTIRKPCAMSCDYFQNRAVSDQKHLYHQYSEVLLQDILKEKTTIHVPWLPDDARFITSLLPGLSGLRRRLVGASVPQHNNFAIFNPQTNSCIQIGQKTIFDRLFDLLDEFHHLVAQKFTPLQYPDKQAKHMLRSVWEKNNTYRGRQVKNCLIQL